MPTYADVCRRMLTYADVCRRMLRVKTETLVDSLAARDKKPAKTRPPRLEVETLHVSLEAPTPAPAGRVPVEKAPDTSVFSFDQVACGVIL